MLYNTLKITNDVNNQLEYNINNIYKKNFRELVILAISYYLIFTFLFIFSYNIFSSLFTKDSKINNNVNISNNQYSNNVQFSSFLAILNIPLYFQKFSYSLFNSNFMVLSFIYSDNSSTKLLLTKRDIYSYELLSKIYNLEFSDYKVGYMQLTIDDLALINLFVNFYKDSSNKIFNLIFDSNLNFFKSYEYVLSNENYKLEKAIYKEGFYYMLFSLFNKDEDLKSNDKVILLKMDFNYQVKDIKLIKLPYSITSIDFYYPFIFFNLIYNDQNKGLLIKIEDKSKLEFLSFFVDHNYTKLDFFNAVNFKDNYFLIFKSYDDSISNELIFININYHNKIKEIIAFKNDILNLIDIKKTVSFNDNLYFIYEMKNDQRVLGIFKINLFNYSYFNKVIFTNEERYIKLLDVGSIFNNLLLFWDYSQNNISILSLNLLNENKINNSIDPIFITDFDYYYKNNIQDKPNFYLDNKNFKIKLLLQKDFIIYMNKDYFNLKLLNKKIISEEDLKVSNKEMNFF
jgi:hypothetical protein